MSHLEANANWPKKGCGHDYRTKFISSLSIKSTEIARMSY